MSAARRARAQETGMRASPHPRPGGPIAVLLLLLLCPGGSALAQGQDSVTAPMGPQTSAHPPPLLSSASAPSAPSGKAISPLPIAVPVPEQRGAGLVLPGSVQLAAPVRLACDDIADRNARRRRAARKPSPAPPAGMAR